MALALCLFVILGILPGAKIFGAVDWNVIMMITGTMGVVSLFINSRMPSLLADLIIDKAPNVKWAIVSLALFAGLVSAFVDNVATLGGNLTPIGASANIAGLGILRKEGYEVKAGYFMKISVPFTLAAVTSGYILVWLIWA
ncbi:MAG: hypothetical protein RBT72_08160 [Spirochaetia bacterium]|jgi:Na+/H+ antiporter NhaD/arsenite permease-like protein|nr:hypothetical protein [Spirochaetia bacterium]